MSEDSIEKAIGDLVRLKSGGPIMTIVSLHQQTGDHWGTIWTKWFVDGEVRASNFPGQALDLVEDGEYLRDKSG